jgi:hypothetical protein
MDTKVSVGRGNDVIRLQGTRASYRDCFLAGANIAPPHDSSLTIQLDDPVLEAAGQTEIIVIL